MERMVTVRDMRERYKCSNPTARKYLRQCVPHMENPLVAPEWAVKEWENNRTVLPVEMTKKQRYEVLNRKNEPIYVPRTR